MEFVESYLSMPGVWTFKNKEQNLLTYEVEISCSASTYMYMQVISKMKNTKNMYMHDASDLQNEKH